MNREHILAQARRHHSGILLSASTCDEIVRRLKTGESAVAIGAEMGVGRATMRHYEGFARWRVGT